MAATSRGAALTEQHRQAQQQVKQSFLVEFLAAWALLDSTRLDATGPAWVQSVLRLIRPYRLRSSELSTRYFLDFQAVEAPSSPTRPRIEVPRLVLPPSRMQPTPSPRPSPHSARRPAAEVIPEPRRSQVRFDFDESAFNRDLDRRTRIKVPDIDWTPSDRAAVVSLNVTGPISQKSKTARGKPEKVARDESLVEASGAASRHVLTGGRQSLLRLVQEDEQAVGWIRVTDGDPCAFCAMLASRGIVYSDRVFNASNAKFDGPGTVKVHDHCACTLEAVYDRNTQWPGRAQEFRKLWGEIVGFAPNNRYSGQEAINAFRRAYEQQQRDARRSQVA